MFGSYCEYLVVFMFVGFFPLKNSDLRRLSVGASHFYPMFLIRRVVTLLFSESINEARAISFGWQSHEPIDKIFLIVFGVHFPVFMDNRDLFEQRNDIIGSDAWNYFISNSVLFVNHCCKLTIDGLILNPNSLYIYVLCFEEKRRVNIDL